jgi:hypothetical protein
MRALISVLSISALFALAACDSADDIGGSVRYGVVLSEGGSTAGSGLLTFESAPTPGAGVNGDYSLTAAGGGPLDPLTTTSGSFSGSFAGDSLVVVITAPGTSDVGLRLAGPVSASTYSGNWSEITIAGPQLRGTFVGEAD